MTGQIRHQGVIESIDGNTAIIRILQQSACTSCDARRICNSGNSKEKHLHCATHGEKFDLNEHVTVVCSTGTGMKAVWWGFGLPLILLIGSLFAVWLLIGNETISALVSVGILVIYYIIVYLMKSKIHFEFEIEHNKSDKE